MSATITIDPAPGRQTEHVAMVASRTKAEGDTADGQAIKQLAYRRLTENCPYQFCFRGISCHYAAGVLTLRGRVPTFYLKQVITSRLRELAGVSRLQNEVDVVNAAGLSNVQST